MCSFVTSASDRTSLQVERDAILRLKQDGLYNMVTETKVAVDSVAANVIDTKAAVMGIKEEMLLIEQRRRDDEREKQQQSQHEQQKQLQHVFFSFYFDEDMKRELHNFIPCTRHTIRSTFAAWISTQSTKSYDAKSTANSSSSSRSSGGSDSGSGGSSDDSSGGNSSSSSGGSGESSVDLTSRLFWIKAGPGVGNNNTNTKHPTLKCRHPHAYMRASQHYTVHILHAIDLVNVCLCMFRQDGVVSEVDARLSRVDVWRALLPSRREGETGPY